MSHSNKTALVVGATGGIGNTVARLLAERGQKVILTSRDAGRAEAAAGALGGEGHRGIALDLTKPETIRDALADIGAVDHLVMSAVERDRNSIRDYDIVAAQRAVGLKLIGYSTVAATLADRLSPSSSIVLFGGLGFVRPYPGSTSISTVNGGVIGLTRTLAVELAPIRVNALLPGAIGDTEMFQTAPKPFVDAIIERTPEGRLLATEDLARATLFLLDTPGVNGIDLIVDGGYHLR